MAKCYWCGADNDKHEHYCCVCRRNLEWSNVLKALLRARPVVQMAGATKENAGELVAASK